MRTIEIAEDVYAHLLANTSYIGEDASSILRRLLGLTPSAENGQSPKPAGVSDEASAKLAAYISGPEVLALGTATGKFLRILAFAYEIKPEDFEKVLKISGRSRNYFAQSMEAIERSGRSTHPRRIGKSPYWVVTNADTDQKRDILRRALTVLGFDPEVVRQAVRVLA